jgi:hypothetical protein
VALGIKPEVISQLSFLGQVHPNPAQSETIISYNLPKGTKEAKILITTITGQETGNYALKPGAEHENLVLDVSQFQNGIYLYTLVTDGRPVVTRKLVIAR